MLVVRKTPTNPLIMRFQSLNVFRELVEYHYNRTKHKGQFYRSSKYMGMLMIDKMITYLTTDDRDKVYKSNRTILYS